MFLDVFLPFPDNLLVNLKECRELINDLLQQLPKRFANEHDNQSALGAALQAAFKLMVMFYCNYCHIATSLQATFF
jgi:protein transport protein SEC24